MSPPTPLPRLLPPLPAPVVSNIVGRCVPIRPLLLTIVLASLSTMPRSARLAAQQSVVTGQIVDATSGRPLSDVQISVEGTGFGALSDAQGRFRLTGLAADSVTLEVTLLGFRMVAVPVAVGDTDVVVRLTEEAVSLDGIVVTGTAAGERRRALGNSLSTLDAAEINETAPIANLSEMLRGRAPGVLIQPGGALAGAGSQVRIRGVSSLSLFQEQPLLYVDGVRVDNAIGTAGPQNQFPGQASNGGVMSRLDDFDPDEIERIEVIKGPAAATLYGTEASNGVIQIFTKRGSFSSRPRLEVTVRQGGSWFRDAEDRWPTHFFEDPGSGEIRTLNLLESERRLGNDVFRTGHLQGYAAALDGGTENLRYFLSVDYDDVEGFEPNNDREQFDGRINLELAARPDLDIGANLGLVSGTTNLAGEVFRGIWPSLWGAQPTNEATRGWNGAPPEIWHENESFEGGIVRFTGGVSLRHRPLDWLSHRLNTGVDFVQEDNQSLIGGLAFNSAYSDFDIGRPLGEVFTNRREVTTVTVDYAATTEATLRPGLGAQTSVGFQLFDRRTESTAATGRDFPAPGLESVGAAGVTFGDASFVENTTVGVYLQEQISWQDRVFLTAAVRADDNSAFGEDFDLVAYPKVSGSWVVSEESFWGVPGVNALKLRAAYGQTGQQPSSFAALRTFRPVSRADGTPALTPQFLGNPDLKPERGEEIEVGFEAGLLRDRLAVDFTYYRQTTTDAILERETAPSLGFAGSRFDNIGKIRNSGVELLVDLSVLEMSDLDWGLTFNFSSNENEVIDVGGDAEFVPSTFRGRHQEGFPAFSWFDQRIVEAELDAGGNAVGVLCDGGTGRGGVEPGGAAVPCEEAPELFLGRALPKYQGSISSTVTLFDRVRIHGLVDFSLGHEQYNNTKQLTCLFALLCEENHFPERFDPLVVAGIQSGCCFDWDIQDADFAKLREVSVTYTIPDEWLVGMGVSRATLSVAGRNLAIWSGWDGLDPEGFQIGRPDRIGRQGLNAPTPSQIVTTLRLSF